MIFCKELNKEFTTKEDMFRALKSNENKLIDLKKSQIFNGAEKGQMSFLSLDFAKEISDKAFKIEEGFVYPVISTTRWFDMHGDVHFDGCFKKTVREQQGSIYYALDHLLSFNTIAAWPKDVFMFVSSIPWQWVGKDIDGDTQGLVFKIAESALRPDVLDVIKAKKADFENSIRMQYVKVRFAIDSKDKDFAINKAYFDARIDEIANKDEVLKQGYFFGVEELKIYKEGSLVVRGGSNSATSIILPEAAQSTTGKQEVDPPLGQSEKKEKLTKVIIKMI